MERPRVRALALRLARYSATPGSFEAFERYEYELDARDIARQLRVPTAILMKEGCAPEEGAIAEYNAALIPGALVSSPSAARPLSPCSTGLTPTPTR